MASFSTYESSERQLDQASDAHIQSSDPDVHKCGADAKQTEVIKLFVLRWKILEKLNGCHLTSLNILWSTCSIRYCSEYISNLTVKCIRPYS